MSLSDTAISRDLARSLKVIGKSDWYNFYHIHPSLYGHPKRSLQILVTIDRQVRTRLLDFPQPWQSWIFIDLDNSDLDAVYIHTANPYKVPFPFVMVPGRITRNFSRYARITRPLSRCGYSARKIMGSPSIFAVPKSV